MKKRVISLFLCLVMCLVWLPGTALAAERSTALEEGLASTLNTLGLFRGTDTGYDLRRSPTRAEAIVMLIRLLGEEEEATGSEMHHPFTDVPEWAERYVGYAYQNGLTNGTSATEFGTGDASTGMYLTFVLRALGYSDANGLDFTWTDPIPLAKTVGIFPNGTDTENFWRADVVRISYAALSATMKNSTQTLADKLISQGIFTRAAYDSVYETGVFDTPHSDMTTLISGKTELTGTQIYSQCNPAVFCIYTYSSNGKQYAQGSGFFINSGGVAVTNYHVLENARSATATLTDGRTLRITSILFYDYNLDYAVIQVEGSGFPTLPLGDSSQVLGGETIYTIGSPQGLTSTITSGIISNPHRNDYNGMIQFDAPISKGSSGGALINVYGEVIGITTGTISSGQDLNFAVPINTVVQGRNIANYANVYGVLTQSG